MIDPVIFTVFGLSVYWYGFFYVLGFLFSYLFILKFCEDFGISKERMEDIFFYGMLFGVIAARLGHILFYDPVYYFSNLSQIIRVDRGGMSFHGGLIGVALCLFYFSKKYKFDFLKITDLFVVPLSLALAFGRLANFINQELVGSITNFKIGVVFTRFDNELRYPVVLFESIKNMFVFQVLFFVFCFKKFKKGILTAWFLILYNFPRFFIDFLRVPEQDLGLISMGQLLSLFFGFFGVYLLFYIKKKDVNFGFNNEKKVDKSAKSKANNKKN